MSLAATIFVLVLATNIVQWTGHSLIAAAVYAIHSTLFQRSKLRTQKKLGQTLLETKRELDHTSAQNEYAKWTKLNRTWKQTKAEYDQVSKELSHSRVAVRRNISWTVWILTSGAQFVLVWWYRRQPVFYLPPGWFGPLTWFLSLPNAPNGSVSSAVWQFACQRVIKMTEQFVRDLLEPAAPSQPPNGVPSKSKAE